MDRVGAVVRAAKLEVRHRNKALHVGRGTKIIAVARCCVCRPADAVPAEESVPAAERRSPLERMFPPAEVAILGYITCATRLLSVITEAEVARAEGFARCGGSVRTRLWNKSTTLE
jgi:hypothetical protein